MWKNLDKLKKKKYQSLIKNFASLSEAFSQKADNENREELSDIVAPIVNSKFQETAFQKAFDAVGEDISNTSYDASLAISNEYKYLIGIKSFGLHSGDQKIAQFKSSSIYEGWSIILNEAKNNAEGLDGKNLADEANEHLYMKIAKRIAMLRNERIASSKEQVKGFDASDDTSVEAVYHVLMPSKKGEKPKIHVGEIGYQPIDIDNIKILGSTSLKKPTNFKFTDGQHIYKYSDADSQLFMNFHNKDIVIETWNIEYVDDAFSFIENLNKKSGIATKSKNSGKSVSWMIENKNGYIEESSGFNAFDGATKLPKRNKYREKHIDSFECKYKDVLSEDDMKFIIKHLKAILLNDYPKKNDKRKMKQIRLELRDRVIKVGNPYIKKIVFSMVYRSAGEMYIPIPESKKFHEKNPDFFGKGIGTFKENSGKLAMDKENRKFKLEFLASGNTITAYINQDNGKGIQSINKQDILGEWILRGVFQLKEYEPLTKKKLDELGINAIRLIRFDDINRGVGLEFTWIDVDNPPSDAIGWVSKNKKSHK